MLFERCWLVTALAPVRCAGNSSAGRGTPPRVPQRVGAGSVGEAHPASSSGRRARSRRRQPVRSRRPDGSTFTATEVTGSTPSSPARPSRSPSRTATVREGGLQQHVRLDTRCRQHADRPAVGVHDDGLEDELMDQDHWLPPSWRPTHLALDGDTLTLTTARTPWCWDRPRGAGFLEGTGWKLIGLWPIRQHGVRGGPDVTAWLRFPPVGRLTTPATPAAARSRSPTAPGFRRSR